ncbi:hypothetical protein D1007_58982 [Hordeum vulgare]|nr:hypothetical protein D1007_58982 [Hordeum vulgare]
MASPCGVPAVGRCRRSTRSLVEGCRRSRAVVMQPEAVGSWRLTPSLEDGDQPERPRLVILPSTARAKQPCSKPTYPGRINGVQEAMKRKLGNTSSTRDVLHSN